MCVAFASSRRVGKPSRFPLYISARKTNPSQNNHDHHHQIEHEEDRIWTPAHRETVAEMARRGVHFLQWLSTRPEGTVAVVTHSAFLLTLFAHVLHCPEELRMWFANAEMRSVVLHF